MYYRLEIANVTPVPEALTTYSLTSINESSEKLVYLRYPAFSAMKYDGLT